MKGKPMSHKVKQTNKVELEWESENGEISVTTVVIDGIVVDTTIKGVYSDRGSFAICNGDELDDLLEGLQCIKEEIASCVWKAGVCD
jgi:hypothetical protein